MKMDGRVMCVILVLVLWCCFPSACMAANEDSQKLPEHVMDPVEIPVNVQVKCENNKDKTSWRFPGETGWKDCGDKGADHAYAYNVKGTTNDEVVTLSGDTLMIDVSYGGKEEDITLSICLSVELGNKPTKTTEKSCNSDHVIFSMTYLTNKSSNVYKQWIRSPGYNDWLKNNSEPKTPAVTTGINAGDLGTQKTTSGAGASSDPSPPPPDPPAADTHSASGDGAGGRGGEESEPASVDPQKNSGQQEASDGSSGRSQSAHEVPPRSESTVHPDTAPPSEKDKPPAEGSVSEDNDRAAHNTAPTTPSGTEKNSTNSEKQVNNTKSRDISTVRAVAHSLLPLFVVTALAYSAV